MFPNFRVTQIFLVARTFLEVLASRLFLFPIKIKRVELEVSSMIQRCWTTVDNDIIVKTRIVGLCSITYQEA